MCECICVIVDKGIAFFDGLFGSSISKVGSVVKLPHCHHGAEGRGMRCCSMSCSVGACEGVKWRVW
jgi:hypothetical protein